MALITLRQNLPQPTYGKVHPPTTDFVSPNPWHHPSCADPLNVGEQAKGVP